MRLTTTQARGSRGDNTTRSELCELDTIVSSHLRGYDLRPRTKHIRDTRPRERSASSDPNLRAKSASSGNGNAFPTSLGTRARVPYSPPTRRLPPYCRSRRRRVEREHEHNTMRGCYHWLRDTHRCADCVFEGREDEFALGARDGLDPCAAGACVGLSLW